MVTARRSGANLSLAWELNDMNLKQLIFTIASAATIVAIADLIWWVMKL